MKLPLPVSLEWQDSWRKYGQWLGLVICCPRRQHYQTNFIEYITNKDDINIVTGSDTATDLQIRTDIITNYSQKQHLPTMAPNSIDSFRYTGSTSGVTFLVLCLASLCNSNHDARRLYDDLLRKNKYNRLIRPVGNSTDKLTVKMGLKLAQVLDVVGGCQRHV